MKKYLKLTSKASETDVPHFKESKKTEKGYVNEYFGDEIGGKIKSATIKPGEYQGVKFNNFVLEIESGLDDLVVTLPHTGLTYTILNSLFTLPSNAEVKIKVLKSDYNERYKKYFPKAYVNTITGDKVEWKMRPTEFPRSEKVIGTDGQPLIIKGKQVYDDTKVEAFWEDLFTRWSGKETESVSFPPPSDPISDDDTLDLPF